MALLLPEYLQTKKYSAGRVRSLLMDLSVQEGIIGATDMVVTQRAAGANKTVDIAAGAGWVKGDTSARQGLYHVVNDAIVNLTIPDNLAANPRLDQVICHINDTVDGGGIADSATYEVVQGTASAGATLDNRTGAAALPATAMRIADILSGPSFTSITNSVIRDRRPWAHGFTSSRQRNTGSGSSSVTTYTALFTAELTTRAEIASGLVRVSFLTPVTTNASTYTMFLCPFIDGVQSGPEVLQSNQAATAGSFVLQGSWIVSVTPGSHVFDLRYKGNAAVATVFTGGPNGPTLLSVEEILSPNANNGTS